MSSPNWPKRSAPCTIFTANLSPRQIANKAYTLGCKKLEKDDKRNHPKYQLRERVLLGNTISKAEESLNAKTKRHNRRVVSAEDEDDHDEFSHKQNTHHTTPIHSRLREEDHEEEEEKEKEESIPPTKTPISIASDIAPVQVTASSNLLRTDCCILNKFIMVI
ncbi:hypothetical protein BY458DRAFT_497643 [Sporodiniella umbellata]|nr:hypothetical protein BY458DRAFT_497643 [Sporodiniella umbellata]